VADQAVNWRISKSGGRQILPHLGLQREMHEGMPAVIVAEVAVPEFNQTRVLFAARPAIGLRRPIGLIARLVFAVVRGEEEAGPRPADGPDRPQRLPAVLPAGELHQPVEKKERPGEPLRWLARGLRFVTYWVTNGGRAPG
jgi:hypothetical protein